MLERTREKLQRREPVTIVLYGDSISEVGRTPDYFGGATTLENNWGEVLGRLLNDALGDGAVRIRHFAIGGQNTYEGLGRLDWLADHRPDLVLIAFGANDCGFHFLVPEATHQALQALIEGISVRYDADAVVVGTGGDNPQQPCWRHLDETLAAQREAAREMNVPFVDLRRAVLEATRDGLDWEAFHNGPQDCHPTDRGHALWARTALAVLTEAMRL